MSIAKLQKKINRVQIVLEVVALVYVIALARADARRVVSVVVLLVPVVLDLAEDAEEAVLVIVLADAAEDVKKAAVENVKANAKADARELPKEIVIIAIIVALEAVILSVFTIVKVNAERVVKIYVMPHALGIAVVVLENVRILAKIVVRILAKIVVRILAMVAQTVWELAKVA